MRMLETWKAVLTQPAKTYAAIAKKRYSLADGAKHILVMAVITSLIGTLTVPPAFFALFTSFVPVGTAVATAVIFIILLIVSFAAWLIFSVIMWLFAHALGGRGAFAQQSYAIAVYSAPLSIITSIVGIGQLGSYAITVVTAVINFIIFFYGLYVLTHGLKATHRYTLGRAVLTWLIPLIIAIVVIVIAVILAIAVMGPAAFAALGAA